MKSQNGMMKNKMKSNKDYDCRDYDCNYSEFDVEEHAKKYIDYLEVCISPDGKVSYAIPSHQAFLEKIAVEKFGFEEFRKMMNCPESYLDYSKWLCKITGYIMVHSEFIIYSRITMPQRLKLKQLSNYKDITGLKLYRGAI